MNKRLIPSLSHRKATLESLRITVIAAKVYNVWLLNHFQPEIEKIDMALFCLKHLYSVLFAFM